MENPQQEENRYTCHVCGHEMEKFTRICEKCGSIRRPSAARGVGEAVDLTGARGACKRCGVAVKKGKPYCPECQQYMDEKERAARLAGKKGFFHTIIEFLRSILNAITGKRGEP